MLLSAIMLKPTFGHCAILIRDSSHFDDEYAIIATPLHFRHSNGIIRHPFGSVSAMAVNGIID